MANGQMRPRAKLSYSVKRAARRRGVGGCLGLEGGAGGASGRQSNQSAPWRGSRIAPLNQSLNISLLPVIFIYELKGVANALATCIQCVQSTGFEVLVKNEDTNETETQTEIELELKC